MRASRSCNDPELYRKVKEGVSMQQAVQWYGLVPDRKGLCMCPFHQDTHPSLRVYGNGRGFYCFSCGAGGDVVKFAAMFRGISNYEAAKELAAAFSIPVAEPVTYREKRETEKRYREQKVLLSWAGHARKVVGAYRGLLCEALRGDTEDERFLEAGRRLPYIEHLQECLAECPKEVYEDKKAVSEIGKLEGRIIGWHSRTEPDGAVPGRDILPDIRDRRPCGADTVYRGLAECGKTLKTGHGVQQRL